MQHTVFILQIRDKANNKNAWENTNVFTTELAAVNKLAEINASKKKLVFTRGYNARIEERFLFTA